MSPTVFREGPFRFLLFSREEELARNYSLSDQDLRRVEELIKEHGQEIRDAWASHFRS